MSRGRPFRERHGGKVPQRDEKAIVVCEAGVNESGGQEERARSPGAAAQPANRSGNREPSDAFPVLRTGDCPRSDASGFCETSVLGDCHLLSHPFEARWRLSNANAKQRRAT